MRTSPRRRTSPTSIPRRSRSWRPCSGKEAEKYQVLPLDWRAVERLNAELQGRPSLAGKRDDVVYYPGQIALPDGASPQVLNKSFSVTAEIDIPEKGAEGMVYTHGGLTGGYGIYLRDGKAYFVYNMLAVERFTIYLRASAHGQGRPGGERRLRGQARASAASPPP